MEPEQIEHGLIDAPSQYALFENARRARLGRSRAEYAREMGELFAPFSTVAAANPYASARTERSADELVTVTERNRMIADPYPRFVVARDQVNQGAAVVLTSVGAARAAGVPEEKWIYLHGYADTREFNLLERPDLSSSPASVRAAQTALDRAGVGADDLTFLDLYSCFPIAVLNICDGLGLAHDDPRGLTLTGGLPFFGGAGNNYSMHAVVEAAPRLRAQPGTTAFIGANGGVLSKYSAAVYSTTPREWTEWSDQELQKEIDAGEHAPVDAAPDGAGTLETYTVKYDKRGTSGVIIGRTPAGDRFVATTEPGDDDTVAALTREDVFGLPLQVRTDGKHSYARLDGSSAG